MVVLLAPIIIPHQRSIAEPRWDSKQSLSFRNSWHFWLWLEASRTTAAVIESHCLAPFGVRLTCIGPTHRTQFVATETRFGCIARWESGRWPIRSLPSISGRFSAKCAARHRVCGGVDSTTRRAVRRRPRGRTAVKSAGREVNEGSDRRHLQSTPQLAQADESDASKQFAESASAYLSDATYRTHLCPR